MRRKCPTVADVPGLLEATKASLGPQNNDAERHWIGGRYDFLKSKGYKLDERYASDWVPSWASEPVSEWQNLAHGKWLRKHEDAFVDHGARKYVKDAVRITDGLQVIVKLALAGTTEFEILQYLSATDDPRNSAQRILDAFPVPEDDPVYSSEGDSEVQGQAMYIILPLARDWRHPPFVVASEGLAFIQQLLEGLCFLHEHNIAHRDIREDNIMMDPSPLFPHGMNPKNNLAFTSPWMFPEPPQACERVDAEPDMRYFFIDYGSSVMFPSHTARENANVLVAHCGIPAPEMLNADWTAVDLTRYHDPFKADVFALGFMMEPYFSKILPELHGLWNGMTKKNPDRRLSAAASLDLFIELKSKLPKSAHLRRVPNVRLMDFGGGWPLRSVLKERLKHRMRYYKTIWRMRCATATATGQRGYS